MNRIEDNYYGALVWALYLLIVLAWVTSASAGYIYGRGEVLKVTGAQTGEVCVCVGE